MNFGYPVKVCSDCVDDACTMNCSTPMLPPDEVAALLRGKRADASMAKQLQRSIERNSRLVIQLTNIRKALEASDDAIRQWANTFNMETEEGRRISGELAKIIATNSAALKEQL